MDAYDLQARFAPMGFVLLPLALVAFVAIPGLGATKIVAGSIAFILLAAFSFVATRMARAAGRARQDALYASWGGIPTTAMLRFRDPRLSVQVKRVHRERLARLGASFPIPDEAEEARDPGGADGKIGAAMDEIRRRAKERGLKRVHRENINYGAARNAFGLRPFGIAACGFALLVLAGLVALRGGFQPSAAEVIVGAATFLIALAWIFGCTANKVRHHGEAYALEMFEAIETVAPAPKRRARSG